MTTQQKQRVGIAIASLVLGILGLILIGPLGSIPAVICGHIAISRIKKNPEMLTGDGLALAGLIMGYVQIGLMLIVLPLLAAILLPAVNKALTNAGMVQTVSNGANIYKAIFASHMDDAILGAGESGWPIKGQYRTSTDYFIHLVESGVISVTYDFFAAPGIPPAKSSDANDFKAENNAWRLVLGLDDAPDGTPFIFTRNYDPGVLQNGDGPIVLNDEPPFGKEGMVVVLKGGSAFYLKGNQLRNSFFNPADIASGSSLSIVGP
ncbi:MAG TPA: DUF4190 domain-containing protein [Kiritimatiellia bacterium]|nr:DUF4190 domain-containing protein [Kiritimatiellia bacterium]HPR68590.1 DUF4190 domain-containing protein [Kiritimatiellia bacterium]